MPDFTDLISQAKKMQEKMKDAQEALKKIEVEGVSGGNAIKVTMNGDGELKKIFIDDKFDNNGKWREYYNRLLKTKYSKAFGKFNSVIYIKAPSFAYVLSWRIKQENFLRKLNKKDESSGMSPKEIVSFIQHYEKITKWMLKEMPALANLVLYVNKDQKILKIRKN